MDEEVLKWSRKDPIAIKRAMAYPGTSLTLVTSDRRDVRSLMFVLLSLRCT